MQRPTKTAAVKVFLEKMTHADLAARYHYGMEMQCNVAQDGGEKVDGEFMGRQWHAWRGPEGSIWKSFRVPYNAKTEPHYEDKELNFDLAKHVDAIGMTGWNWQRRVSEWVGFDFDAITGHAESHAKKLTEEQLAEVREAVHEIDWVTIRKSTSGKGLHLYVYLPSVPTENHDEHGAIAKSILSLMSAKVGIDFEAKVDSCGGNMWVWHRKMRGTDGLTLLKQGGMLREIPPNWRDYLQVIRGKRRKNLPKFIEEVEPQFKDAERIFEEITGQRLNVSLDEEHKQLIAWLQENGCMWWWDSDHHMLVTHTVHLKEAHEALNLKGIFRTLAVGSDRGADHNVFAFPLRHGAWVVRRYTPGTAEAPTWDLDASGFTRCYYNRVPDLAVASRANEGVEHPRGGFVFTNGDQAKAAAVMIGADINVPNHMLNRSMKLWQKDERVIAEIDASTTDNGQEMTSVGWILEAKKWKKVHRVAEDRTPTNEIPSYDDLVRHLVASTGDDAGWIVKSDAQWRAEPMKHVQFALESFGLNPREAKLVLGACVFKPWTLVNRPFQPEYPGDRSWNRNAAQLRYTPAIESRPVDYPTWNRILTHLGKGLDEALLAHGWARANGITTGADYLKCWIASIFQYPLEPLPYLFFYSAEEGTGKSTFHEAFKLLITKGVERADTALTSENGFNGELEKAVLCVVEETNLKGNKTAHNRIKDWVTARDIPIHPKRGTPFSIPNSSHWVQAANNPSYCPIFTGDTRITMIAVAPFSAAELIPRRDLELALQKEAPYFLSAVLNLEIPQSNDRLNLPVITTREKLQLQISNETVLETFIRENTHFVTGRMIPIADLWERFFSWMDEVDRTEWTKTKMGREMPRRYPKGRNPKDSAWCFGNLSWEARKPGEEILPELIEKNDKLVPLSGKANTA